MAELQVAYEALRADRLAEAEERCRRMLQADAQNIDALSLLTVVLARRGQSQEALKHADQAVAAGPFDARLRFNRALILESTGQSRRAEADYAEACRLDPQNLPARINLANLLIEGGRPEEAEQHLQHALAIEPKSPEALQTVAVLRQAQGRPADAVTAFREALILRPDDVRIQANFGWALFENGEAAAAVQVLHAAASAHPGIPDLWANLGAALMLERRWNDAESACGRALSLAPAHTRALALKAIVLDELGRPGEREALIDFKQFLADRRCSDAPAGYADMASFHAAVSQYARAHPSLLRNRPGKTTRDGGQTGDLIGEPSQVSAALEATIRGGIEAYISRVPATGIFSPACRPRGWTLRAWATVLDGGGYQDPHHHPSGWISGVYYVDVPPEIAASDGEHAGWIEFGRPDPFFGSSVVPDVRLVRPQEGLMLLFPSYLWHRTLPFRSASPRVSIAFDVIPVA